MNKKLIVALVLIFLCFTTLGYIHSRRNSESPDALEFYVVSHLVLEDQAGTCYLRYRPSNETLWSLNLQTGIAGFSDPLAQLKAIAPEHSISVVLNGEVVEGFLGGVGGMWSAREVYAGLSGGESSRKIVLFSIVSAISGYGVGYCLGILQAPSHVARRATVLLSDRSNYPQLKRLVFQLKIREDDIRRPRKITDTDVAKLRKLDGWVQNHPEEANKFFAQNILNHDQEFRLFERMSDPEWDPSNEEFHQLALWHERRFR